MTSEQELDKPKCPECGESLFERDENGVQRHKSDGSPECGSTWKDR